MAFFSAVYWTSLLCVVLHFLIFNLIRVSFNLGKTPIHVQPTIYFGNILDLNNRNRVICFLSVGLFESTSNYYGTEFTVVCWIKSAGKWPTQMCKINELTTRKHSSRMRTVHCSGYQGEVCEGCCPEGVSGGCVSRGVCFPGVCIPLHALGKHPTPL